MAAQAPPAGPASTAISARVELGAAGCALTGGLLAAVAGPLVTFGVLGALLGLGVVAVAAYRPVFATYAYLGALPFVAGLEPVDNRRRCQPRRARPGHFTGRMSPAEWVPRLQKWLSNAAGVRRLLRTVALRDRVSTGIPRIV